MKLSPVYRKDALIQSRSAVLPLVIGAFNGFLTVLVMMNLYSIAEGARTGGEPAYAAFLRTYYLIAGIELALIALIAPALTASSISGERERRTLELLLTTQLGAGDIVVGKLLSALSAIGTLIASSLPVLATVFVYGGVTFGEMALLLCVYLSTAAFGAAAGICVSSYINSTAVATAASYALMLTAACACFAVYLWRSRLGLTARGCVWALAGAAALLAVLLAILGMRRIMPRKK